MIHQQRNLSVIQPTRAEALPPTPILLDSPSTSSSRVTFDPELKVQEISFNNGLPAKYTAKKFEIKDKTLILSAAMKAAVKSKAKKYYSMVAGQGKIMLKYRRRIDIDTDLRALGLRAKTYIENKIIVAGIGYRETEESLARYFGRFAEVQKVVLEKNSKGFCMGKGTVTFASKINTGQEFRLSNRILRIERIKCQTINMTRMHVSHMSKDVNISRMRAVLKKEGLVPKNIRIDMSNGKNLGYGFVEFNTAEEAEEFANKYAHMKEALGPQSYAEFSKEKNMK